MTTSKRLSPRQIETTFCRVGPDEGIGTLYERLVLSRLFRRLANTYRPASVLEYQAFLTKGWDNLTFANRRLEVTVADSKFAKLASLWPAPSLPVNFSNLRDAPKADLVWNFAVVHLKPNILAQMARHSSRYVLVFTPNVFNWGWPLHTAYHLIARNPCRHPERGNRWRRTRFGLAAYVKSQGLKVRETGYVDMPIWPDFAFSKAELNRALQRTPPSASAGLASDPDAYWSHLNRHTRLIESRPFAPLLAPVVAHHQYVLAQI